MAEAKVIFYAVPVGQLRVRLDHFFEVSRTSCGPNAAHSYMPHCSLTGFITTSGNEVRELTAAATEAIKNDPTNSTHRVVTIDDLAADADFLRIRLTSPWLIESAIRFRNAALARVEGRDIRLKTDLHLSLAYGFDAQHYERLCGLATDLLGDLQWDARWMLSLYRRSTAGAWQSLVTGPPEPMSD